MRTRPADLNTPASRGVLRREFIQYVQGNNSSFARTCLATLNATSSFPCYSFSMPHFNLSSWIRKLRKTTHPQDDYDMPKRKNSEMAIVMEWYDKPARRTGKRGMFLFLIPRLFFEGGRQKAMALSRYCRNLNLPHASSESGM